MATKILDERDGNFQEIESELDSKASKTEVQTAQSTVESELQTATQNLQAQIDNIVSDVGDVGAEVYQARVGADGTTYQTLKERLDTETEKAFQFRGELSDLNYTAISDATEIGCYNSRSTTTATMNDKPVGVTGAFSLIVNNWTGDGIGIVQILIAKDGAVYQRFINNRGSIIADWASTSLAISNLNSEIYTEVSVAMNLTYGKFWDVSEETAQLKSVDNWYASAVISVIEGEAYKVYADQGSSHKTRVWTLCDDNMNIVARAADVYANTMIEDTFVIPQGATKLVISHRSHTPDVPYLNKKISKINELNSEFIELKNEIDTADVVIPIAMEIGGMTADGANAGNDKRARTPGYLPTNPMIGTIHFPEGTEHRFGYYSSGTDVSVNSWSDWSSATEDAIDYPEGDSNSCFRILMRYSDDRTITSDLIPQIWFEYEQEASNMVSSASGYYISSTTPAIGKKNNFELSPLIPVQSGVAYKATKFRNTLLFDADLRPTRLLLTADITDNTVPILTGEKYICFCWRNTDCPEMFFAPASEYIEGTVIDRLVPIPLLGKKLSLLGDSISSYAGTIPAGNDVYYTGNNSGVSDPTQMWWSVLCRKTGMVPCVINGWSGSAITQLTDSAHVNKVPMSDISRCQALHTESADPDVILIAGGVNDYSYAQQASQKPGTWDGTTAPVNGNSFDETYAVMIKNIQTAYPKAVIICLSTWFTMRGTDNGYTLTNNEGLTQSDYDAAIKKVATLMRVPYIDVERCGFSRSNFYPNYAEDSSSIPTHPNARGQRVMGELIADELPQVVAAFLRNVPKT